MTERKLPDGDCDDLIETLDKIGRNYHSYDYGLPTHDPDTMKIMRMAVREWLAGRL